jgi:hypothetical protein
VEIIMGLNTEEAQQLGRIEAQVDILVDRDEECFTRINKLEGFASRTKGALCVLSLLFTAGCAWLIAGCAHMHGTDYYPDGKVKSEVVSTVLGSGEATLLIQCENGEEFYTTRSDGISDNAVETVEAAVTVTPPGAAAGVFGGVIREILE